MTARAHHLFAAACTLAFAAACGSESGPTLPFDVATDSGQYTITVSTEPNPPTRGDNRVIYRITDAADQPAAGLQLAVVPWMPAHGHGSPTTPTIEGRGGGEYVIDKVNFFMAGRWELRTTITSSNDHAVPTFDIP